MTRSTSSPLSCNFLIVTLNKYSKQPIIHSDINCIFEMIIKTSATRVAREDAFPLEALLSRGIDLHFSTDLRKTKHFWCQQNEKATTLLLVLDFPLVLC